MKYFPISSLALVLALSGCSSAETEISPQEKRNNFDACVIEWHKTFDHTLRVGSVFYDIAVKDCSYHLE